MNREIPWWTGAGAVAWLAALVGQSFLHKLSTVDVASQPATDFLRAIADHRAVFTAEVVTGALVVAFALVTVVGLTGVLKDDYLEPFVIGAVFVLVGSVILLVAFAMYGNLVGTSMEFIKGSLAPTSTIAQQGDIQGDQFEIIYFLGQVTLSIGMGVLGVVLVRAGYARTLFGVAAVLVVALSPFMYHLSPEFMLARVAWLGLLAYRGFTPPEGMPVVA
jgi:hypothetical protein